MRSYIGNNLASKHLKAYPNAAILHAMNDTLNTLSRKGGGAAGRTHMLHDNHCYENYMAADYNHDGTSHTRSDAGPSCTTSIGRH